MLEVRNDDVPGMLLPAVGRDVPVKLSIRAGEFGPAFPRQSFDGRTAGNWQLPVPHLETSAFSPGSVDKFKAPIITYSLRQILE